MLRSPSRFLALAILFFVVAAQMHVWVESGPVRASGHACQVCVSGGWAIISAGPNLDLSLRMFCLETERPQRSAKTQQTEASAPRAPPSA